MVNIKATIIIFLLFWLGTAPISPPSNSQIICSAFCAPTNCVGWTASDCNSKCNTGWGWTAQGGPCSVTGSGFQYLDSSDDAGGMISVSPNTLSNSCPNLTGYTGTQPYGDYPAKGTLVNLTLSGGTDVPHYAVDLIFDIILVDTDSNNNSRKWTGTPNLIAKMYLSNGTIITNNFKLGSPNPSTNYNGYCGSTSSSNAK